MKSKLIVALLLIGLYSGSANSYEVWEDMNIRLSNGSYIWAKVNKRDDGCYNLLLGGSGMQGTGVNCSSSLDNGNWSVTSCIPGHRFVWGGVSDVVAQIVEDCS